MYLLKTFSIHQKIRSILILLSFIVASKVLSAQTNEPCFNPAALKNICLTIENRTKDASPKGDYVYLYQRKLLDAACVDIFKDDKNTIARKVSAMWNKYEHMLICNSVLFDTPNGSLIKFPISSKFDSFIYDLAKWGVNLNTVGETDGKTALDYVQHHMKKNSGSAVEEKLKVYYKILRDVGAKHASEL